MLKPEDCKPGVEIISLTSTCVTALKEYEFPNGYREKYKIYTIKEFIPNFKFTYITSDCVLLNEIIATGKIYKGIVPFSIINFKLIDPKQMDQFYRLVEKPVLETL